MSDSTYGLLIALPILLLAATLHEIAHALAAEKLGDRTARNMGRITLNPIAHIDLFMTILLPASLIMAGSPVVFGGAKPVPVNPSYFKNPRVGMALVAAAGPASNIILAISGYILAIALGKSGILEVLPLSADYTIRSLVVQWVLINIMLAIFNLFPLPPLDGGRIMTGILPLSLAKPYSRLEPYGLVIIFILLYADLMDWFLLPVLHLVMNGFTFLTGG